MTYKDFGLTPDAIQKYVVRVEPSKPIACKTRDKYKEAGLTARGTVPVNLKHPDLAGLPYKEYCREISRRWRARHAAGMSSGQRKET